MMLLTGNSNKPLAEKIAQQLKHPLAQALVGSFKDGESRIEILDPLQGQDVFIIQSTSTPANHHFVELVLMIDAARRAFAHRITAVIPYFGYARQDKRAFSTQMPISAKVCADLLTTAGVDNILTVDLHTEQLQGFFSKPIKNILSGKLFLEDIFKKNISNPLIVSPDSGGVVRARAFAKKINAINATNTIDLAIIDKQRPHPNETEVMNLIGTVADRNCIIVDDLIDTANTVCLAAKTLKEKGAKKIFAYVTHAVLSEKAVENIEASVLDELVVTDTISLNSKAKACSKIRVESIAPFIAEAIRQLTPS